MSSVKERCRLAPTELRWRCDPKTFAFSSTAEIPLLQEFVGQDRALQAIEFGLAVEKPGYNIFVTGLTGTGKASAIHAYLQRAVARRLAAGDDQPVFDWCYVHNFDDPDRPAALRLPVGRGAEFKAQMAGLLNTLRQLIVRAFSEERYQNARQRIAAEVAERQQRLWQEIDSAARQAGFLLQMGPTEVSLIPLLEGQPATPAQVMALAQEQRAELERRHNEVAKLIGEAMQQAQLLQREGADKVGALDAKVAEAVVSVSFAETAKHFQDLPEIVAYLQRLQAQTMERIDLFRGREAAEDGKEPLHGPPGRAEDPFLPFRINVFVDNSRTDGAPIIVEHHPTFTNLFGRIERRPVMGGYVTDHTMLKPGSIALANGGYLVTTAREVFANPGVWEGLKRALRNREVRIEDPSEMAGMAAVQGLKPQPIPLDIKVVLISDNVLYRLAWLSDEDFSELFKVKAEFDRQVDRTDANLQVYASFIATCCETEKLLHFDREGVAAVLEQAARDVGSQTKLSARFGQVRDLVREADHWARQAGATTVSAAHVCRAVAERINRVNIVQEHLREMIEQGVILIDVDGASVGQINALSVLDLGDIAFGVPTRITARTFAGRSGVVNIERESQLSGRTHDKGVLILCGLLGARFAQRRPLSLSASLCFEQSYEGVDGDSASSTEYYALLSSLSGLPIDQSLAVTGSVNQKGQVQAIGGVNEKVEGFFDVCRAKGLTGRQGVIVPRANVPHLMLRGDVVEAVAEGRFHIYAVDNVDEGIELLTGVPAGVEGPDGTYPEGTVNALVAARLEQLAEAVRSARVPGEG